MELGKPDNRDLLIISCSATKKHGTGLTPAIELYDGPAFRILRNHLNKMSMHPHILILSAKHGLIDAYDPLYYYDVKMNRNRALEISSQVQSYINDNIPDGVYNKVRIWAGKNYLLALPKTFLIRHNIEIAEGPIGIKLRHLKNWCIEWQKKEWKPEAIETNNKHTKRIERLQYQLLNYFMPDWDDYLDSDYDFINDRFSWNDKERIRTYAHQIFNKTPIYDGMLVSLGHIHMSKGVARNGLKPDEKLAKVHRYWHLKPWQLAMGDCGAFSYKNNTDPPFTVKQAIQLYNNLGVDIGASVDHIPFGEIEENGKSRPLTNNEIEYRIELTARLAKEFLAESKRIGKFVPMGVIQARTKDEYASLAEWYIKAGYEYIAIGGLVPKKDKEIYNIAEAVVSKIETVYPQSASKIRIHLFGVLREQIISNLLDLGIASFDSASYLRKAWLRSDKNYLSQSGNWYSAIRVPFSSDPRFQKHALDNNLSIEELTNLEANCLRMLRQYEIDQANLEELLDTVLTYDNYLLRTWDSGNYRDKYKRTLEETPWKYCKCPICQSLGMEVIIFRGYNRNKRRGFHNTRIFYKKLQQLRRNNGFNRSVRDFRYSSSSC